MESESKLYLQSLAARGLTQGSIKTNATTLHKLRLTISKPLCEVTYADLVAWQAAQTVGNTTKHHRTQHVKAFFQWAQDTELITSNPARHLARPKRGKRLPELLSEAELNRLLAWKPTYAKDDRFLEARDRFLIRLFMYTGIRRAEACALTVGDVSVDERLLRVRHGKGDKDRAIPLPDRLMPDLAKYLKVRGGEACDPLLPGRWSGRALDPEAITRTSSCGSYAMCWAVP